MTRVRAREHGKLRAAVLALAARAFNFRHWDTSWRVTPELLRAGEVGIACSVLYRPFSELDLDEPYSAPPESAYYAKLVELIDAVEREVRRTGGTIVRSAADLEGCGRRARRAATGAGGDARGRRAGGERGRRRAARATCTASRAASTSARRRRR